MVDSQQVRSVRSALRMLNKKDINYQERMDKEEQDACRSNGTRFLLFTHVFDD